ncbi:hypothetical protein GGX14DRAFT_656377 [Mycena pura]|uniref:Uncharacterized protein n=1 Tax=Mycena pura TaxID=153505 RepID=A0AAD6V6S6_9AGAR|nr:hypothetical protein GGX14DRAFT_656377 [Mycena pura]
MISSPPTSPRPGTSNRNRICILAKAIVVPVAAAATTARPQSTQSPSALARRATVSTAGRLRERGSTIRALSGKVAVFLPSLSSGTSGGARHLPHADNMCRLFAKAKERAARYATARKIARSLQRNVNRQSIKIYREEQGQRFRVDHKPEYSDIVQITQTVFSHLVESVHPRNHLITILGYITKDPAAKAALVAKRGDRKVNPDDIRQFLVDHTPTIVVKALQSDVDPTAIIWGQVIKGNVKGASDNEIFMTSELADALIQTPPSSLSDNDACVQRARQKLLWSFTLAYETIHAITKFFFSPNTITPLFRALISDDKGHGEAGRTFEKNYFGFHLEAAWLKADVPKEDRMWRISNLLAAKLTSMLVWTPLDVDSDLLVLTPVDVDHILESFSSIDIWSPEREDLNKFPGNNTTHTRYRISSQSPMTDEVSDEDDETRRQRADEYNRNVLQGMVVSSICDRTVGMAFP